MFKKTFVLGGLAILLASIFIYFFIFTSISVAKMNIYMGEVVVVRENKSLPANSGFSIKVNDVIKTGNDARASLLLEDGSAIRLDANSEVLVGSLQYEDNKISEASFKLIAGNIWSKVEPVSSGSNWEVETPTSVASVRGTQYNSAYTDFSTEFLVYKGRVGVSLLLDLDKEISLEAGKKILMKDASLTDDFEAGSVNIESQDYDDWTLFNLEEDAKLDNKDFSLPEIETTNNKEEEEILVEDNPEIIEPKSDKKMTSLLLFGNKSNLLINEETKLKVQAKYSDGSVADVPFALIEWSMSTNIGSIAYPGYYSSGKVGSVSIKAIYNGIPSNEVKMVIKESFRVIKRVEITYVKNQYFSQTNYEYPQVQFTATAVYDSGPNEDVTSKCQWSVEGDALGVINSNALYTPQTRVVATIKSVCEGKSSSTVIQIP